jgi:hypothetical protein
MRLLLCWLSAGWMLLYTSGGKAEEPGNCVETFQTPEFQALDLREPYGVDYLLKFLGPLKGQSCTLDQLETFFNSKHAVTFNRDYKNVFFWATLETSGFFFKKTIGIGATIEGGKIVGVTVGMEGL